MRTITFLVLLSLSALTYAGGDYYFGATVDTYDPISGLYYKAVSEKEEGSFLSKGSSSHVANINIFDPQTGKSTLLLKPNSTHQIVSLLFETGYKDGSVTFSQEHGDVHIKNNAGVTQREPKDKFLVAVYNSETKFTSLQVSNRKGENLKELASVPEHAEWHVDVKNSKIRVVQQTGDQIHIESHEW
jgi:hypothetical protein